MLVSVESNPFIQICQGIGSGVSAVIKDAKDVHGDVSSTMKVWRSIGNILAVVSPTSNLKLRGMIHAADIFVDAGSTACAVKDLVGKTDKEDVRVLKKLEAVTFLAVGVGSIIQFLDYVNVITLPVVSTSSELIGRITIGLVGHAVTGLLGVAFLFMGVNSTVKLVKSFQEIKAAQVDSDEQKKARLNRNQNMVDIAFAVAQVAFFTLGLFALASGVALVAVGVTGATLGVASYLYSVHKKDEIDKMDKAAREQLLNPIK